MAKENLVFQNAFLDRHCFFPEMGARHFFLSGLGHKTNKAESLPLSRKNELFKTTFETDFSFSGVALLVCAHGPKSGPG